MQFNKPTLIVIAGPNGSGKTAITTQILKHEWIKGCVYINFLVSIVQHFQCGAYAETYQQV